MQIWSRFLDSGPDAEPALGRREVPIRVRRPGITGEEAAVA
jgi:hypothetical protein